VPTNPDEVPLWLAAADLGLYYPQFEPGRFTFWGSPIKFLELIAMGKPVVTLRLPHWAHEVERADAGVFTDATPEAFAQGVLELVSDPARMREMGRRGAAAAARQHTWQAVARGILTQCGVPIDD
jgi:glycosyltransferase involved in cell wall biosynthesis